jgi:hypothetical protein
MRSGGLHALIIQRSRLLCLLPASPWFLAWLLWPWRCMQHVPPKRRLTFKTTHHYIPEDRTFQTHCCFIDPPWIRKGLESLLQWIISSVTPLQFSYFCKNYNFVSKVTCCYKLSNQNVTYTSCFPYQNYMSNLFSLPDFGIKVYNSLPGNIK